MEKKAKILILTAILLVAIIAFAAVASAYGRYASVRHNCVAAVAETSRSGNNITPSCRGCMTGKEVKVSFPRALRAGRQLIIVRRAHSPY